MVTSLLGGVPLCNSLGIIQWNSTRRDHPGNPGGVSESGLVIPLFQVTGSPRRAFPSPRRLCPCLGGPLRLGEPSLLLGEDLIFRGKIHTFAQANLSLLRQRNIEQNPKTQFFFVKQTLKRKTLFSRPKDGK